MKVLKTATQFGWQDPTEKHDLSNIFDKTAHRNFF